MILDATPGDELADFVRSGKHPMTPRRFASYLRARNAGSQYRIQLSPFALYWHWRIDAHARWLDRREAQSKHLAYIVQSRGLKLEGGR